MVLDWLFKFKDFGKTFDGLKVWKSIIIDLEI